MASTCSMFAPALASRFDCGRSVFVRSLASTVTVALFISARCIERSAHAERGARCYAKIKYLCVDLT